MKAKPTQSMGQNMTQAKLKRFLTYDPDTGIFRWRVSQGRQLRGSPAGFKCPRDKHLVIAIDGQRNLAHRLALLYLFNWTPAFVSHINGEKCDNRIVNLTVKGKRDLKELELHYARWRASVSA
jgi:hypothetical protein